MEFDLDQDAFEDESMLCFQNYSQLLNCYLLYFLPRVMATDDQKYLNSIFNLKNPFIFIRLISIWWHLIFPACYWKIKKTKLAFAKGQNERQGYQLIKHIIFLSFVLLYCIINFDLKIKTYNYFRWWVEKTVIHTNSCNLRLLHHQNPYHYQQSNLLLLLHWPSQVQKASSLSKMSWLIPDGATTLHNLRNAGSKLFHV